MNDLRETLRFTSLVGLYVFLWALTVFLTAFIVMAVLVASSTIDVGAFVQLCLWLFIGALCLAVVIYAMLFPVRSNQQMQCCSVTKQE